MFLIVFLFSYLLSCGKKNYNRKVIFNRGDTYGCYSKRFRAVVFDAF